MKLKDKTFKDFLLHSFFKDEKLINAIALPVFGNGGFPPSLMSAFVGAKIFSEFLIDGGYYPADRNAKSAGCLSTFSRNTEENCVLYRKRVKKILLRHGQVKGVSIRRNEVFSSNYLVSACDARQTFINFLGEKIVRQTGNYQVKNYDSFNINVHPLHRNTKIFRMLPNRHKYLVSSLL